MWRFAALEQAARLESVDDPGHVRRIARERIREGVHRDGCSRLELLQHGGLHGGEVELGRKGAVAGALQLHESEELVPGHAGSVLAPPVGASCSSRLGRCHLVECTDN